MNYTERAVDLSVKGLFRMSLLGGQCIKVMILSVRMKVSTEKHNV